MTGIICFMLFFTQHSQKDKNRKVRICSVLLQHVQRVCSVKFGLNGNVFYTIATTIARHLTTFSNVTVYCSELLPDLLKFC